jgi:hypothetical protein
MDGEMKILRLLCFLMMVSPAFAADDFGEGTKSSAQQLAGILKQHCPVANPSDQEAFDHCRKALFNSSEMEKLFAPRILWGRFDKSKPIWQHRLTSFDSKLWTGLYLPLMMFDGEYELKHDGRSYWAHLHMRTGFRGRLAPGQFSYPFWHDAAN